ncbi:DUF1080 domain-containing protein [Pontibacter sp. E15-1]|uniref:3-keto-disaccharide hydrolase n=1 Tax=Pontibacter sp. E15-1 TaxID=2919918 RepID=UPI001F4FB03A|nr:DUF1080 domain-containing protein [Pontibacter sp. E15-1]MCJ8165881.1 DUF1080 domain-containing protein [Pontibacter sp. E15-1]
MNNTMRTKAILAALAVALLAYTQAQAQETPKPPKMVPEMTEFWEPEVRVVTPAANSTSAPSDAIVLFDGKDLSQWKATDGKGEARWKVKDNAFTVGKGNISTKQEFGDFQLHIEWSAPDEVKGTSQGRGNSGIFLQDRYEVQVLDNYENRTYANGQAGSVYKQHRPLVNAMRKPSEWNVYDIIYTAPRFKENGALFTPARVTVLHNGVLVQNNVELKGPTEYIGLPEYKAHGKAPISLQDHGNPVQYRNIWIREL